MGLLEAGVDVAAVDRGSARLGGLEAAASGGNIQGALRTIHWKRVSGGASGHLAAARRSTENCGAPIAWKSIAMMPIEPD